MTTRRAGSVLVAATALALAACGTVDTDPVDNVSDGPPASALPGVPDPGCPDRLEEAVSSLSSGLPAYDYDPATSVAELVGRVDVVVTGMLHAVERPPIGADEDQAPEDDDDPSDDSYTVVSAIDVEVLAGEATPPAGFDISSFWSDSQSPDPLQSAVELVDVRFVAFLHEFPSPTGWNVDVQGLFVACDDGPFERIIEPPPPDAGTTIDELVAAVGAAAGVESGG